MIFDQSFWIEANVRSKLRAAGLPFPLIESGIKAAISQYWRDPSDSKRAIEDGIKHAHSLTRSPDGPRAA